VAGLILTGFSYGREQGINDLMATGLPAVVIWEKIEDPHINYVGFDNFQTAFTMTEYLIGLSHECIGLIMGPYSKVGRVRRRWEGFQSALTRRGLKTDPDLIIEKEPTLQNGQEAMHELLDRNRRITAVFAASDILAIGALKAARERGLQVPRDLSIAGHDDNDFAAFTDPPLTTVRVDSYEIGRLAAEVLLEKIENDPDRVHRHCLETPLVIRESCGKKKDSSARQRR
jgi:DNA-binding LacI/PurR family transcriptional regulator